MKLHKIGILDYGVGNIGSIKNMVKYVSDAEVVYVDAPEKVDTVEKIILPGVGKFDYGMECLENRGLDEAVKKAAVTQGMPLLGICLGMQLLGNSSEEGKKRGLGLIDFEVIRFQQKELPVPHMGWNYVTLKKSSSILAASDDEPYRFYFVHSYYAVCNREENILMTAEYGWEFTAAVGRDNIYGTQFHPEKSHKYGKKLVKNFIERC